MMAANQTAPSRGRRTRTREIQFCFYAPQADTLYLAGTFNDWDPTNTPMTKDQNGHWSTTLHLAPGRYEYRFVADNCWLADPEGARHVPNPFGSHNSVIEV